jgi:hypothetical protein
MEIVKPIRHEKDEIAFKIAGHPISLFFIMLPLYYSVKKLFPFL